MSLFIRIPRPRIPGLFWRLGFPLLPSSPRVARHRKPVMPSGIKMGDVQISNINIDEIRLSLCGADMLVRRWFTSDVPHEVSTFIPRAEIEVRRGLLTKTTKMTLNSITIVHAPRFPPASA